MYAKSEFNRDRDGFLKCKDCPRRFLTKAGFENHSSNQHKKETESKLDQTNKDESSFQKKYLGRFVFWRSSRPKTAKKY